MDDLLNEFLTETNESIDEVDQQLVVLEQDPNNKAVLDNIFRLVHTIKGTCGFLGLPRLESVAHASENVLGQFRDGLLSVTPNAVTVILASLDRIKEILEELEATEQEPAGDDRVLIQQLDDIILKGGAEEEAAPEPEPAPEPEKDLRPGEVSLDELEAAFANAPGPDDEATPAASDEPLIDRVGGEDTLAVAAHMIGGRLSNNSDLATYLVADIKERLIGLLTACAKDEEGDANALASSLVIAAGFNDGHFDDLSNVLQTALDEVVSSTAGVEGVIANFEKTRTAMLDKAADLKATADTEAKAKKDKDTGATAAKAEGGGRSTQTIRVNVDLLEDLMNMVSEMVLTRNQLMQMVRKHDDSEFAVPLQRLSQTTTELQESVMKTRMQPIGNAWNKLPRIIRDLSLDLDKKIELEMIGAETELDRQVLELIKDPLTHMVRNSADHGIETPAVRLAAGKPATGTVKLKAFHEGGHIIIEISDDGHGISVAKLSEKIVEKGLASEAEVEAMSDAQIQKFIFHAGFSTAQKVTSVSGRGVGMDVVRTNIEKIGGTIELNSVEGQGTSFAIKIPLTLAIISALIVEATGERFAVPQISVLELVRTSETSEHTIERIKDTPVLRLRNRLLPLVYLNEVLGFVTQEESRGHNQPNDQVIMVAQVGAFSFGIVVDQVFDTEEIVVKPVASVLKEMPDLSVYSGNTILGDGNVIMILDPNGIAAKASTGVSDADAGADEQAAHAVQAEEKDTMLIFRAGNNTQKAVPLALVSRLEDYDVSKVEAADGKFMVQYRGTLMPVIMMHENMELVKEGRQPMLVFSEGNKVMGLAVDEILDIVEEKLTIEIATDTPGLIGSGILNGKATEVVDIAYYLEKAFGRRRKQTFDPDSMTPQGETSILLVDDSSFFRNMIKPLLTSNGYTVTTSVNALEALTLRDENQDFDLIISDIEMPGLNGFEFAKMIKEEGRWMNTPLVALSNRSDEADITMGKEAGFNDYVPKFDRDGLLVVLSAQLSNKGKAA